MRVESLSSRMDFDERRGRVARERRAVPQPSNGVRREHRASAASREVRRDHSSPQRAATVPASRAVRLDRAVPERTDVRRGEQRSPGDSLRRSRAAERRTGSSGPGADGGEASGPMAVAGAADGVVVGPGRRMADRQSAAGSPGASDAGADSGGPDGGDDGSGDEPDRRSLRSVKLAVVVQRYGADISGGAELHARYIAERLARHARGGGADDLRARLHHVAERAAGRRRDRQRRPRAAVSGDAPAQRRRVRPPLALRLRTAALARRRAEVARERGADAARRSCGTSRASRDAFDFFVFFSYRYYHAWHGVRAVPGKAVLVPTAERDRGDRALAIFAPLFRGARALMYNSFEERALITACQPARGPGRGRRRRIGDSRAHAAVALPQEVQRQAARSRSTSAASTRTRAARSCSRSSSGTR